MGASIQGLNVAIVGVGLVGEQVVHQLTAQHLRSTFRLKSLLTSNRHLEVVGDQKGSLSGSELIQSLKHREPFAEDGLALRKYSGGVEEVVEYLLDPSRLPRPLLVVDCTSSQAFAEAYPRLLSSGNHEIHLVTPNKKAFSGTQVLFNLIEKISAETKNMVFKEATVGAGLPVLSSLRELILTGDEVIKIEGILSGTMSYIFNQFSQVAYDSAHNPKMTFSEVVKQAQSKGYTEPNPADDLDGSDVARKLSILIRHLPAQTLHQHPSLQLSEGFMSVSNPPLLPHKCFEQNNPKDFMTSLAQYDDLFEKKRLEAFETGCLLRFVGVINIGPTEAGQEGVRTSLEKYPFTHPFCTLSGSDNILAFYTKRYPTNPLIIRGAGAGAEVTAMGVVGDMIKVAERLLGHNISV